MTGLDHRLRGPEGAPVLVLSNSLGTTQELWAKQLPALAERFRVLTYDHPGHGVSDLPQERPTVESLTSSLVTLLDELQLERVSLCGVSLGGMVGITLALEEPERVDRLVLACTSAYVGPPEGWTERARMVRTRGMEAVADTVIGRWFTPEFQDEEPQTVARFRAMLAATPPEGYARCCEALGAWDARERVSAIAVPVLVVAGEDDPAISGRAGRARCVPSSRARVFESSSARPTSRTSSALRRSRMSCSSISDRR